MRFQNIAKSYTHRKERNFNPFQFFTFTFPGVIQGSYLPTYFPHNIPRKIYLSNRVESPTNCNSSETTPP